MASNFVSKTRYSRYATTCMETYSVNLQFHDNHFSKCSKWSVSDLRSNRLNSFLIDALYTVWTASRTNVDLSSLWSRVVRLMTIPLGMFKISITEYHFKFNIQNYNNISQGRWVTITRGIQVCLWKILKCMHYQNSTSSHGLPFFARGHYYRLLISIFIVSRWKSLI